MDHDDAVTTNEAPADVAPQTVKRARRRAASRPAGPPAPVDAPTDNPAQTVDGAAPVPTDDERRGDMMTDATPRIAMRGITKTFPGLEKVYAMSAGREIRVFVKPAEIDDLSAIRLARDIANKIEATLKYPGTIKVNVIRETRAEEYAK